MSFIKYKVSLNSVERFQKCSTDKKTVQEEKYTETELCPFKSTKRVNVLSKPTLLIFFAFFLDNH